MSYPRGNLFVPGPAGAIECIVKTVNGRGDWAAVSHPHPQHGGTMHNKIVYRCAKALWSAGFNVLRYNFRGVGHSAGRYDAGRGEREDLIAVLEYLEQERTAGSIVLAGVSFGAWINAQVGCPRASIAALLHVALAASFFKLDFLQNCNKPTIVVQGDRDEFGEWHQVVALVDSMPNAKLYRVEGATHLFEQHLDKLEQALAQAVDELRTPIRPIENI